MAGGTDTRKVDYPNKQIQSKASIIKMYADLGLEVDFEAGNSGQIINGYAWGILNGNNGGGKPSSGSGPNNSSGGSGKNIEAFVYYYHPDHLGSSSYITDANGEVSQHMEYFAFGETFLEEHSNTDRTPYLYNGKELDEETGLYYYGARYYDAKTSVWQSVDPLAEKYPNFSPYTFVGGNPSNNLEVDGRFWIRITKGKAVAFTTNFRWAEGIDKNTAIPVIGGFFELAKLYPMLKDPSYNPTNEDYGGWALGLVGFGTLKAFKKFFKLSGLDELLLGASQQFKESLYSTLSNPDRAELGVEYLTMKSLEKDGLGQFKEDSEGKNMHSVFSFNEEYVNGLKEEINKNNKELSQQQKDHLLENKLNDVVNERKEQVRNTLEKNG